jgi:hypothetical protein
MLVRNFLIELKTQDKESISVYFNNADSPPTFGDFMVPVMLARFLALSGFTVSFIILDEKRRSDWGDLTPEDQESLIHQHLELAKYLLPISARVEIFRGTAPKVDGIVLNHDSFYALAPYFLHLLITKHNWKIPIDFLLHFKTKDASKSYVAWNVRKGIWDTRRNSTPTSIRNDFEFLRRKFPNHSIMLFSTPAGLEAAFNALTGKSEVKILQIEGTKLIPQPTTGFQNSIPYLLSADFYFQRAGGGLGFIPVFSTVPYVYLCPDRTYFYGWTQKRIAPWSTKSQLFVYLKLGKTVSNLDKLVDSANLPFLSVKESPNEAI